MYTVLLMLELWLLIKPVRFENFVIVMIKGVIVLVNEGVPGKGPK